jgi:predicted nucleotidyltransferase
MNTIGMTMSADQSILPSLFKSEDRIRILRFVSLNDTFSVHSVSNATGVSKGLASLYLNILVNYGLLSRSGRVFHKRNTGLWSVVKLLQNLDQLTHALRLPPWARGIGIYGSWARGTNTSDSDLDIWVLVDNYDPEFEFRVAESDLDLSKLTNGPVHTLILTREKLAGIASSDQPFYANLIKDSITIEGESLESA